MKISYSFGLKKLNDIQSLLSYERNVKMMMFVTVHWIDTNIILFISQMWNKKWCSNMIQFCHVFQSKSTENNFRELTMFAITCYILKLITKLINMAQSCIIFFLQRWNSNNNIHSIIVESLQTYEMIMVVI